MAYKIEVTGENIQVVFQDVMNLAIVMGQGGNNAFRPVVAAPTAEPVVEPSKTATNSAMTGGVTAEPNPPVAPLPAEKRKPGRPPKVQVVEATAHPDEEAIQLRTASEIEAERLAAKKDTAVTAEPAFTLKDVQARLRVIDENFKGRADVSIDTKVTQKASVDYMVQLLSGFGAKTTRDLKPDQFAAFMAESEGYVTGATAVVS